MENVNELINNIIAMDMTNFFYMVIGGLITGMVTYITSKKLEKRRLRKEIELAIVEKLIELIIDANNKAFEINHFSHDLEEFNIIIESMKEDDINNEFWDSRINMVSERIKKDYAKLFERLEELMNSMQRITNAFEAREVVLHKLDKNKQELIAQTSKVIAEYKFNSNIYHDEIHSCLLYKEKIDENRINELEEYYISTINEMKADVIVVLHDLKVALQNVFLSELFDYKVPERIERMQ